MFLTSSWWRPPNGCWRYRQPIPSKIAGQIVGRKKILITTSSPCVYSRYLENRGWSFLETISFKSLIRPAVSLQSFFCCVNHSWSKQRLFHCTFSNYGTGSVVSIATAYGLDGRGFQSRWGWDFPHLTRLALKPIHPPIKRVPGLSRG